MSCLADGERGSLGVGLVGTEVDPLELVIVGAGPQALALLLRLLDDEPDGSGDFFVGLGSTPRSTRKSARDLEGHRCSEATASRILSRVAVLDEGGQWLSRWDEQFGALEIPHLRSTYDQHPCCYDSFALQQYARQTGRSAEVVDLDASVRATQARGGDDGCDCDAPKASKTGCGFRGNFRLPSTRLFRDFVDHVIDQYPGVRGCVRRARVEKVERVTGAVARVRVAVGAGHEDDAPWVYARRVVVAAGPSATARLPDWSTECARGVHAWDVVAALASGAPGVVDPGDRVAVVGGGLTSAHLCFVAERRGATPTLVARRRTLRVAQYDLDLAWLGWRTRPGRIAKFLGKRATPEDRLAMLHDARKGGSVSPEAKASLDASPLATVVADADVVGSAADAESGGVVLETLDGDRLGPFDRVWWATGGAVGVNSSPLLEGLQRDRPVPVVGGYPVLHASLRWDADTPVYVVGAPAALALGPDALNLAGTRMSSCRVAAVFRPSLRDRCLAADPPDADVSAKLELDRARRLEELVVDYVPRKGTVVVRGRPGDAAKGSVRTKVQGGADPAKPTRRRAASKKTPREARPALAP